MIFDAVEFIVLLSFLAVVIVIILLLLVSVLLLLLHCFTLALYNMNNCSL